MISAVIPVFNEYESLPHFLPELQKALQKLDKQYEILFIDDGSTDGSLEFLKKASQRDKKIKLFSFRKNQGKSEALTLGFQMAKGEYIVTLDADLQDRPEEIQTLYKKAREGYDLVCGWRKKRKDPIQKVISSRLFNFFASIFWGLQLHDYNCGLKLYTSDAAKSLRLYGGMHRFIPLLVFGEGFIVTEVAVAHSERAYGKSKYGFSKLWKDLPDILTMLFLTKYGRRPLHFFGMLGGILSFIGIIVLIYLSFVHFSGHSIGTRPLLFLGIVLLLAGLQVLVAGFLADLFLNTMTRFSTVDHATHFRLRYRSDTRSKEEIVIGT